MTEPFVFEAMGTVVSVTAADGVRPETRTRLTDAFAALEDRFLSLIHI